MVWTWKSVKCPFKYLSRQWLLTTGKVLPFILFRCFVDLSHWPSNQNCTLSAFRQPPPNCITSCNFSFLATVMSISLSKCFILPPQHSHLAYRAKSMNQVKGRQVGRESVRDRHQEGNREWEVNPHSSVLFHTCQGSPASPSLKAISGHKLQL